MRVSVMLLFNPSGFQKSPFQLFFFYLWDFHIHKLLILTSNTCSSVDIIIVGLLNEIFVSLFYIALFPMTRYCWSAVVTSVVFICSQQSRGSQTPVSSGEELHPTGEDLQRRSHGKTCGIVQKLMRSRIIGYSYTFSVHIIEPVTLTSRKTA